MIRSLYYTDDGAIRLDIPLDEFPVILKNRNGLLWVDFENTLPETDEPILRDIFGFHPLAVDDALQESHIPKVDDWGEYLYLVFHSVEYLQDNGGNLDTLELDIFIGANYLVTHHDQLIASLNHVWEDCQRDDRHLKNGSDNLLYRLVDEVVTSYLPIVELLDDEIEKLETNIFNNPHPRVLERIFDLKRAVARLRRAIGPQREVLNKLARDDYKVIDSRARVYFRDVYDHLVRLHEITESIRDLVSGALDIYLSVINNRMNDIIKTLTIITTMFMPVSFVVGFFGMNFFLPDPPMTAWTQKPVFVLVLVIISLTPFGMVSWMRRRGWM